MSSRSSITDALIFKLKGIDGSGVFQSNVFLNVTNKLKFWDEVSDFPYICVVPGSETREYLPSSQKWGFLNISLKVYVKADEPVQELENLLEDIEKVVDSNRQLQYSDSPPLFTTEILITSIVTDEGLLAPYGVGEINLQVRYPVL